MRNLDAPVAASHRAYAITVGLQDEHGNQITAVEVKLTGFATLGELLTVLEVVRTSDALLQAQAEVMSSTQEEFAKNLADLQHKAKFEGLPPIPPELIIDERTMDGLFPEGAEMSFRRYNADGIEVDENGQPVPVDPGELLDSVLRQFADGGVDEDEPGIYPNDDPYYGLSTVRDADDEEDDWSAMHGELDIIEMVGCSRCDGCGQIADSDDGEPWTAWTSLPAGSRTAVDMGLVKPVTCPTCDGEGQVAA